MKHEFEQVFPIWKRKPGRSAKHLAFIRRLPCLVCSRVPSDAHHIRIGTDGGAAMKPSDRYTVPLCSEHHAELHRGELTFWTSRRLNPHDLASRLYAVSGDLDAGELIVCRACHERKAWNVTLAEEL